MSRTPHRRTRPAWSIAALAALSCLLAACSAVAGGAKGGSSDGFTLGVLSNFLAHFTPGRTASTGVDYAVWTPLTTIDAKTGKVDNAVAESVQSTDNKVWTIRVKQGWTFHNGEPVTAQSFADSWNTTAYGPNAIMGNFNFSAFEGYAALNPTSGKPETKQLSGVKVVDPNTLTVTLTKPLSMLPYLLAQSSFAPMAKTDLADLEKSDKLPTGNGPYKVTGEGLKTGVTKVTLQRYDAYAGTKGVAKRIEVKSYQDETALYTDYRAGNVDVATVSGNNLTNAMAQYKNQVVPVTFPAVVYLGFPLWDSRFADPRVRQAFSLAVDRETIVKSLLHGLGEPAKGLAPASLPGGGVPDCGYCGYDPDKAKALLAAAGGWTGPLKLWTYQDPTNTVVLEAIANQLRTNLGIQAVTTQAQPADQLYPNMSAHKTDGPMLLYMGASYPHLYALADQLFTKGSATNVTGFDNAAFTGLLAQAATASPDRALTLSQQGVKAAMDDLPLTPLYQPMGGLIHSKRVGNMTAEVLGGPHVAGVTVS
jgi:peptide/nickel transport system substrate-binding protein/oligopeptide transport system substrate-binding protein